MRFKVFLTFLAVQIATLVLWQGSRAVDHPSASTQVAVAQSQAASDAAAVREVAPAAAAPKTVSRPKLNSIHFSATHSTSSSPTNDEKNRLMEVISKLPASHTSTLRNLVLDYDPNAHRGLGGKTLIILRAVEMDPAEAASVLIHEIGHIVDLGLMKETDTLVASDFRDGKNTIYASDPSLGFYTLSWANESTRKKTMNNLDFVSGYAMTDPFEDFAESYVYYVLHNKEFAAKAQSSAVLQAKYDYLRDQVFNGKVYETGKADKKDLAVRPWDVTVLATDLDGFLNS